MSKKFSIITISILLSALFLNIFTITPSSAESNKSKIYKQRTFNIEGKGSPEEIAQKQDRAPWSKYEPTGIYVTEDEEIKVNVRNNDKIQLFIQSYGEYGISNHWDEEKLSLTPGNNTIKKHKSGVLYLANLSTSGHAEVSIDGGSHIPVFEKTNSDADFITMMAAHKDAPYVEYVSDYALITISYKRAQEFTKNPSKLLQYIDTSLEAQDKLSGFSPNAVKEINKLDRHYRHLIEDTQENVYMYATHYRTAYASGGKAVKYIVDADVFKSDGWGPWHENGHIQQQESWKFHEMTEVYVNLYSLASQLALGNEPELETRNEYKRMLDYFKLPAEQKDYDQLTDSNGGVDFFLKLTMVWQLHLGLGDNFYPNLHAAYRELPEAERPNNTEERKNYFIYMASKVSGRNLLPFFDMWGLNPSKKTRETIADLKLPMLEAKIWESTDKNPIRENIEIPKLSKISDNSNNGDNASNSNNGNNASNSNNGDSASNSNNGDNASNSNNGDNASNSNNGDNASNSNNGDNASNSNNGDSASNSNNGDSASNSNNGDNASNSNNGDNASNSNNGDNASNSNNGDNASNSNNGDNGDNGNNIIAPESGEQNFKSYFIIISSLSMITIFVVQLKKRRTK